MDTNMIDIAMFIYATYKGSERDYALNILGMDLKSSIQDVKKAYKQSESDFTDRIRKPVNIPDDTINYSAAFDVAIGSRVRDKQLNKFARRAQIAYEILDFIDKHIESKK
ncbi:hypothetical protein WR164_10820 [Philodulcilactobacillus myokoensis]|uniref:Uncharacterized protein n=1 Tax=Philodulcilactobacillus myokoensis TaxID=2929573 RepID=A0A9W6B1U4_9LACO|nr:hypothetical protein [Philodulcilactobacillus myokoensis]GLB47103.1 hypothetical protein WR164_10820 [Philodulcilactobacillus myokoensis]